MLYVGRFTAVKRLPILIAAHARASERLGTPAPLVLVGGHPGEWEGEHPLAAAARLGNRDVFLAGWRAHELLPKALNAADLLVLPSVGEAFGLVLVEAMACGLPVVACATHGPAAIVADSKTGWLVPSRRRTRAHRRARRGRKRSRGTTRPWRARPRRKPPLRLAGDRPPPNITVRGAAGPRAGAGSPRPALRPQGRPAERAPALPWRAGKDRRASKPGRPRDSEAMVTSSQRRCPDCAPDRAFF